VLRQQLAASRSLYGQRLSDPRSVFALMDKDGGGSLDAQEFEAVSHFCAWIGPPCLRQCVHGAPIGGSEATHPRRPAAVAAPTAYGCGWR
jgi:hypothetical protein